VGEKAHGMPKRGAAPLRLIGIKLGTGMRCFAHVRQADKEIEIATGG
jgi:hypothetical protein